MEKFNIIILEKDLNAVRSTIQEFVLRYEPPFRCRLQRLLPIMQKGSTYTVSIFPSRNIHVINSNALKRIGFYAAENCVLTLSRSAIN